MRLPATTPLLEVLLQLEVVSHPTHKLVVLHLHARIAVFLRGAELSLATLQHLHSLFHKARQQRHLQHTQFVQLGDMVFEGSKS